MYNFFSPKALCLFVGLLLSTLAHGQTIAEDFESLTLSSSIGAETGWSVVSGSATASNVESANGTDQSILIPAGSPLGESVRTVQGAEWGTDSVAWWDVWVLPMAHVSGTPAYTISAAGSMIEFRTTQIEFDGSDLVGYGGGQDGQYSLPTTATVTSGGSTIQLEGNSWKALPYQYMITPDTVLTFEVDVVDEGEIIGISLETDLVFFDEVRLFRLAGTDPDNQQISGFSYSGSGFQTFTIPVGQYYASGVISYIAMVADDDANGAADITFRNVSLHEGALPGGEQGMLVVSDGDSIPLPTYFSTTSNASDNWMRLTLRQDFSSGKWDLYLDGVSVPIAANIDLLGTPTEPTEMRSFGDGTGPVYFDELGLYVSSPIFTDIDNDGMDDAWETLFSNMSTASNDRDADLDMDSKSNLEEYMADTSPDDYYNDALPTLTKTSGDQQTAYPGIWLESPLVVNAQNSSVDLENAPIEWTHLSSLSSLAAENKASSTVSLLEIRTDSNGDSTVYVKAPDTLSSFGITATANTESSQVQQTFTVNIEPLRFIYDAEDGDPSNDFQNDSAPTVYDGNNVYTRTSLAGIRSAGYIPIDPSKQYRLSGLFRSVGVVESNLTSFGFTCYYTDASGNIALLPGVNVYYSGDEAEIVSYDDTGANVTITLASSPSGWNTVGAPWNHRFLGYYIGGDTTKLPDPVQLGLGGGKSTFNSIVGNVIELANGVTLPTSVVDALNASETVIVRNHRGGDGNNNVAAVNVTVPGEWMEYKAENITGMSWTTQPYDEFWMGTEYVRIFIYPNTTNPSNQTVEFDDLVFEEITDYDADNIPDWWEWRIIEANPSDGLSYLADVGTTSDFDGDGLTDDDEYANGTDPLAKDNVSSSGSVYYVNNMRGSDTACNGQSATNGIPTAGDGPYRTITKAINTASSGDAILVYETRNDSYDETTFNLAGKNLVLRPSGRVVLK
ncbi:thrombospondin type 3 repeat-containing protein [Cerasicoccus arenae]|uniref:Uncharacterized protein n=1 Tax=Cerasicoccus arenae TaxID=424488 RepID=A0A8J3DJJ1_9BACT|nr:thrombospondin type 3 repeat-containing protein [Cerasicoccus arenae]MBK1859897.1 hypothetical protein [Cerasicoccus arenae]GHC07171.1 hypothetical protein GCM10007047_25230 [Cerasicoccus arenae]